ncbi:DNA-directed RNA polymerase II subunit GRINL1A isoform X2 [Cryptotermes secundus]|nr:DNA-directed RNA polymerase II subunit GRINL1A isoform X2 [Cryptotermes secundus]
MLPKKIIKKIPGNILEPSRREKQGYIDDLNTKTKAELLELVERQDKLLTNKSFLRKLPDKGEKISKFRTLLAEELSRRDEVEKVCDKFSGLNVGKSGMLDEIEWTGKYSQTVRESPLLDSDDESDEERNPLKILATQSGVGTYKKRYVTEEPEERLIKPEDLKDAEYSVSNRREGSEPMEDAYVKHLCDKFEKQREKKREPFRTHRITKTKPDEQSVNIQQSKKPLGPHWEVTAATPPPPIHGDVKLINLQESLHLQKEQAEKLKDIQAKQAAEKLKSQLGLMMGNTLLDPSLHLGYRDEPHHTDSSSSSEDEMANSEGEQEDEEPEKDGAVVYNIVD